MTDFKERIKNLEKAFGGKTNKLIIINASGVANPDELISIKKAEAKKLYEKEYDLDFCIIVDRK